VIGRRVLVTASRPGPVCRLLEERGALPVAVPTIAVRPVEGRALDGPLETLGGYDWVVVTSPNGARFVTERLPALARSVPAAPKWAVVGPRTREILEAAGLRVSAEPRGQVAAGIPDAMGEVAGARVLLLRAATASRDLPRALAARGAQVDDVVAYEVVEGPETSRSALVRAVADGLDAAVFTSGSTVRGFARLIGDPAPALAGARIVCIGPVTARVARESGLEDVEVARGRTPAAIVAAVAKGADG
jgi:uroporphyrinogen III methyltransferase / synthase